MLVPSATCSRFHDGRISSARATSGTLTLTTISLLEVPAGVEVEVGVGGAGEAIICTQWRHPLYGLIVQRNGIRDAFGTLFSADFARTS